MRRGADGLRPRHLGGPPRATIEPRGHLHVPPGRVGHDDARRLRDREDEERAGAPGRARASTWAMPARRGTATSTRSRRDSGARSGRATASDRHSTSRGSGRSTSGSLPTGTGATSGLAEPGPCRPAAPAVCEVVTMRARMKSLARRRCARLVAAIAVAGGGDRAGRPGGDLAGAMRRTGSSSAARSPIAPRSPRTGPARPWRSRQPSAPASACRRRRRHVSNGSWTGSTARRTTRSPRAMARASLCTWRGSTHGDASSARWRSDGRRQAARRSRTPPRPAPAPTGWPPTWASNRRARRTSGRLPTTRAGP